jgi:hypothetical protein
VKVALSMMDFLDRGATIYRDRVALVDEPDQPAAPLPDMTFADLAARARAQAAALDAMGVGVGERVAVVSHNAARVAAAMFGVAGSGRIFVPINFRLTAAEVGYIVNHCGASVLMVDPELDDALAEVNTKHRFVIGAESDEVLYRYDAEPQPWEPDEDATAFINYTSGTTARPKGVQLTHRNLWLNAATFGWHTGVSDRDVYLHTLPMFHCNGWGMPLRPGRYGCPPHRAPQGRRGRDPAPHRTPRRDDPVRRPAVLNACSTLRRRGTARSRAATGSGWSWPARRRRPHHRAGRDRARLGVHPDLRSDRDVAPAHDQPQPGRVGRPRSGHRARRQSCRGPGRRHSGCTMQISGQARCWPGPT